MSIAGHVSRAMLSRYARVRMRQGVAPSAKSPHAKRTDDEKRKLEIERQRQAEMVSQTLVVQ